MSRIRTCVSGCIAAILASCGVATAALPPVTSGLTLQLTASTGVVTSGSAVTAWNDQSGKGFNLTQGAAAAQPTLVTNALNGQSVIRFDGNSDYMESAVNISSMIKNNAYTTFVVYKVNSVTRNSSSSYDNSAIWSDTDGYIGLHVKSGGPSAILHNYAGATDPTVSVDISTGQYQMLTGRHEAGNLYLDLDGGGLGVLADGGVTQNLAHHFRVSGSFNVAGGNTYLNGDIAELLMYDRALTLSERQSVQSYLIGTWGVPEPSSMALIVLGSSLLMMRRRCSDEKH